MSQPKYRIYPSALSKFQDYLDADIRLEDPWNKDADGNYKESLDEISDRLEQELLDAINRVPYEETEAQCKGTLLNDTLDRLVLNTREGRPDITVWSGMMDVRGEQVPVINAKNANFQFPFSLSLCKELRSLLRGAVPQYRCSAILPTVHGDVLLYGDVDYILQNRVIDLKSTKIYNFGKFEQGWQKDLYPYCLIESGDMTEVSEFEYLVVKWKEYVGQPIDGEIYSEVYTYNHEASRQRLTVMCTRFIEWLEAHRALITDKKIFNEA